MERGVQRVVNDSGHWPCRAMPCRRAAHWASVAKEEDIGGLEKDGMHGLVAFRLVAFDEGDTLAETDQGFDFQAGVRQ